MKIADIKDIKSAVAYLHWYKTHIDDIPLAVGVTEEQYDLLDQEMKLMGTWVDYTGDQHRSLKIRIHNVQFVAVAP